MGSKGNLLTLRSVNSLNYSRINSNEFLYSYILSQLLISLFLQQKYFLTTASFFLVENKIFLTLKIFFRVIKLFKFLKLKKLNNPVKLKRKFLITLFQSFKKLQKNVVIFSIINLNFFLKKRKKKISILFKLLKRDGFKFFPRRFKFFLEFLQINILFINKKISASFLIKIYAEIFKVLQKKLHGSFFNFLVKYFKILIQNSKLNRKKFNLKGLKIQINGKLKGKARSSSFKYTVGTVPNQTIGNNIEFARSNSFTIYGVFGIKLWIFR